MAEKADAHSTSSLADADKAQPKPTATHDHLEHYVEHTTGYSHNLRAVQEAQGFKPADGRLVVDPAEARIEYGDEIASRLKTNSDGTKILWPQRASRAALRRRVSRLEADPPTPSLCSFRRPERPAELADAQEEPSAAHLKYV